MTTKPNYMVAVETFVGMQRFYFDSIEDALAKYNSYVRFGRTVYFDYL